MIKLTLIGKPERMEHLSSWFVYAYAIQSENKKYNEKYLVEWQNCCPFENPQQYKIFNLWDEQCNKNNFELVNLGEMTTCQQ